MTKAGEGKLPPKTPDLKKYHQELEVHARKFEHALQGYLNASAADKPRLKAVMDTHLQLIQQVTKEITRAGVHKEESKLESSYRQFLNGHSAESIAAIEQDLETLRNYNQL